LTIGGAIHASPFCVDLTVQVQEMKGSEYWVVLWWTVVIAAADLHLP
jgi:hypothetical protein